MRAGATLVIVLIAVAGGCLGPGSSDGSGLVSAPTTESLTAAIGSASPIVSPAPSHGIGVSRAAVEAAVDAELGPGAIVWSPERVAGGSTEVDGKPKAQLSDVAVILQGPADDLVLVGLQGSPVTTSEEAHLVLAVIRATVPAAEDWLRASLGQPTARMFKAFDSVNVIWGRDVMINDGRWSMLYVTSTLPALPGGVTYPPVMP